VLRTKPEPPAAIISKYNNLNQRCVFVEESEEPDAECEDSETDEVKRPVTTEFG